MVKEVRNYTNFRQKLCIIVACIAAMIFMLRFYAVTWPTSVTWPTPVTWPRLVTVDSGVVDNSHLETYSNDPFDISYVEENLLSLDQKDPQLISYTRIRHLTQPSKLEYNFKGEGPFRDPFSGWVADFFNNKTNGIFIEAGANEGERGSHTLHLEKELGWTGLLVECNPTVVPYLRSHHRKAWIADVCLSPSENAATFNFSNPADWSYSGTLGNPWNLPKPTNWTFFDVQAIPLYTLLAAVGLNEIDYFSFDIEGQELSVLRSFPFDLVTFKVLIVEVYFYSKAKMVELDNLLLSNGYIFVRKYEKHDKIYVHNSVKHMIP